MLLWREFLLEIQFAGNVDGNDGPSETVICPCQTFVRDKNDFEKAYLTCSEHCAVTTRRYFSLRRWNYLRRQMSLGIIVFLMDVLKICPRDGSLMDETKIIVLLIICLCMPQRMWLLNSRTTCDILGQRFFRLRSKRRNVRACVFSLESAIYLVWCDTRGTWHREKIIQLLDLPR